MFRPRPPHKFRVFAATAVDSVLWCHEPVIPAKGMLAIYMDSDLFSIKNDTYNVYI